MVDLSEHLTPTFQRNRPPAGPSVDLIRSCGGVELPAIGRWPIGCGQQLTTTERRRLAAKTIGVDVRRGALNCAADPSEVTLELELGLSSSRTGAASTLAFEGCLVEADRFGRWRFIGTAAIDDLKPRSIEVIAAYQGVFQRSAVPVALLSVKALAEEGLTSLPGRSRNHPLLAFRGDLNAEYRACTRRGGVRLRGGLT